MAKLKPVFRPLRSRLQRVGAHAPEMGRGALALVRTRAFSIGIFLLFSFLILSTMIFQTKTVRVVDGDGARYVRTFRTSPEAILSQCGLSLSTGDEYRFNGFQNNFGTINLIEAFPVRVTADGVTREILLARGTVSDALRKARVQLSNDDLVSEPLSGPVSAGMHILIQRVSYRVVSQTQVLGYSTQQIPTSSLKKGTQAVQTQGQNGELSRTIREKYVDGRLLEQAVLNESVTVKPVNATVLVGNASDPPASGGSQSGGFVLSNRGTPTRYTRVINGVATAYTAAAGSGTASGLPAGVGHVAVNPRVIPYGTRLYIAASDGSFVYGYAVAADTGAFVTNGSGVDADLFFATESECNRFGRRNVKIYVLQ